MASDIKKLAIDGGSPVRKTPFAPWPNFENDEIDAAIRVLKSGKVNYWTGDECGLFEQEFAAKINCDYAITLANGTVALELALLSLGLNCNDEVIVPCRTFIASASCIVRIGAIPVMCDVDPVSQVMTAETMRNVLTPQTKAVIAVHLAGWPCDMDSINQLAKENSVVVIEDCAQAHGATYKNRPVGSLGDVAAFSFCQDKIITAGGEGGMLTTSSRELWERAWAYKDHGKSYEAVFNREHPAGFRWLHETFGTNMRMTEVQAAIGRKQFQKLDAWVEKRQGYADVLNKYLEEIPSLRVTTRFPDVGHSYYKYYVFVRQEYLKKDWNRQRILEAINAEGIPCFSGVCGEIYLEKAFAGMRPQERLPVAQKLGETSLMFLVHPTLEKSDIDDTCTAVEKVMTAASK